MRTKDFSICLDMTLENAFLPFEVVEGDTGNCLHITLNNGGEPLDLTDCYVCVVFSSSTGFAMQDDTSGLSYDDAPGCCTLQLYPTSYGAGIVSADVQVYSGASRETLITSKRFDFRCRRSLIGERIIRANVAYPPLISAIREATEATNAALAAAASIELPKGEFNVQADWEETDAASDAFIRNKPAIPAAPDDVGAAPASHAARHGSSGADPITAGSIGAEERRQQYSNTVVAAEAFDSESGYEDFPYRAAVALEGVLSNMTPEVVFGVADATSGIFAPAAACYDGGVYIYASEIPDAAITIPTIMVWKAVE